MAIHPGLAAWDDHANAVLTAVGYNFRLIFKWLRLLLRLILKAALDRLTPKPRFEVAS